MQERSRANLTGAFIASRAAERNTLDFEKRRRYAPRMLLTRAEQTFDWGGAQLRAVQDKDFLVFAFSQFLYGEVTGIQCGHWLYHAPDLEAAAFFARQAQEELGHVRAFAQIFELLGARPQKAHLIVRWLSTGMMPDNFAEHVAVEMALGEGLVLMVFYGLIDTIDHPGIKRILEAAVVQEERHVEFGEKRTRDALMANPRVTNRLLGQSLVSLQSVGLLALWLRRRFGGEHPVLRQLPEFLRATVRAAELRLRRIGLLEGTIGDLGAARRAALMAGALASSALGRVRPRGAPRLLTDTYLDDPALSRHN